MLNILIFGPPGAGKGTQAEILAERFSLLHLSTGQVIRDMIAVGDPLGLQAQEEMKGGKLASDELVCRIIEKFVEDNRNSNGIIFDGFPRTTPQAVALEKIMANIGEQIDAMIALDVPDEIVVQRIQGRAATSGRADDMSLETIMGRIETYKAQTEVVAKIYQEKGRYFEVDNTVSIEEVSKNVCELVEKIKKL